MMWWSSHQLVCVREEIDGAVFLRHSLAQYRIAAALGGAAERTVCGGTESTTALAPHRTKTVKNAILFLRAPVCLPPVRFVRTLTSKIAFQSRSFFPKTQKEHPPISLKSVIMAGLMVQTPLHELVYLRPSQSMCAWHPPSAMYPLNVDTSQSP